MANYDSKPSIYEANGGNGSYTYRWGITEKTEERTSETGETEIVTTWTCSEVVVWATVTRAKLTATVLGSLWNSDDEAKLVNDYNAAKEGVFGSESGEEAQKYIGRYKDFLGERKSIKDMIAEDCKTLNIAG